MTDKRESDISSGPLGEIDFERNQVTLPFTPDQFGDFISSLLGKTEKLERHITGSFEFSLSDIREIYYKLEERIYDQNRAYPIQFSTKIFYNDDSSIEIPTIERISNYSWPESIIPERIELNWQYLIAFESDRTPKKQEIEIYIETARQNSRRDRISFRHLSYQSYLHSIGTRGFQGFTIKVSYTTRSWATDIDASLSSSLLSLMRHSPKRNRVSQFLSENSELVGWFFGVSLGILFFVVAAKIAHQARILSTNAASEEISRFLLQNPDINARIDFLIKHVTMDPIETGSLWPLVPFIAVIISAVCVGILIQRVVKLGPEKSYILIARRARQEKEIDLRAERTQLRNFVMSVGLGILINIVSSYIYQYLLIKPD